MTLNCHRFLVTCTSQSCSSMLTRQAAMLLQSFGELQYSKNRASRSTFKFLDFFWVFLSS